MTGSSEVILAISCREAHLSRGHFKQTSGELALDPAGPFVYHRFTQVTLDLHNIVPTNQRYNYLPQA